MQSHTPDCSLVFQASFFRHETFIKTFLPTPPHIFCQNRIVVSLSLQSDSKLKYFFFPFTNMKASWTRAKPKPFAAESYSRSQFCPSDPSFTWRCGGRDFSSLPLHTSGAGNCPLWLAFQIETEQNIWARCSHCSSALLDHSSSNSTSPEKCPFPQKTVQPSPSLQPKLSRASQRHQRSSARCGLHLCRIPPWGNA